MVINFTLCTDSVQCYNFTVLIYDGHFQANLDLAFDSVEEDEFRKTIFAHTDAMI